MHSFTLELLNPLTFDQVFPLRSLRALRESAFSPRRNINAAVNPKVTAQGQAPSNFPLRPFHSIELFGPTRADTGVRPYNPL